MAEDSSQSAGDRSSDFCPADPAVLSGEACAKCGFKCIHRLRLARGKKNSGRGPQGVARPSLFCLPGAGRNKFPLSEYFG